MPLLAGIPLALLAKTLRQKKGEQLAVAEIEKCGGTVWFASEIGRRLPNSAASSAGGSLADLFLDAAVQVEFRRRLPNRDVPIRMLQRLPKLHTLILSGSAVTDADLGHLGWVPLLERIYLQETRVTDDGLAQLRNCPSLADLNASGTSVTGSCLPELANCSVLSTLLLDFCPIKDSESAGFAGLHSVRHLSLYGTPISDQSLLSISHMENLEILNVGRTEIHGAGIDCLAACASLREFEADDSEISDDAVSNLACLRQVSTMTLIGTNMSQRGLERLRRALPRCNIIAEVVVRAK